MFQHCCVTDCNTLPTMNTLQSGLLNDKDCMEEFMSFTTHVVRYLIDDPGVQNPKEVMVSPLIS